MLNKPLILLAAAISLSLVAGCPELLGGNSVTLQIINDTDFEVDPRIVTIDDDAFLGGLFGGDDLATGILFPGDVLSIELDCKKIGSVFSDAAELLDGDQLLAAIQPTSKVEFGEDVDCGDVLRFRFVGDERSFGVIVSINGIVVR